jgi:uncharacterized protein YggT (Ycf19 family)
VFFFAMIISVILSWVAPGSTSPGAELVNQITEPALAPFRKIPAEPGRPGYLADPGVHGHPVDQAT